MDDVGDFDLGLGRAFCEAHEAVAKSAPLFTAKQSIVETAVIGRLPRCRTGEREYVVVFVDEHRESGWDVDPMDKSYHRNLYAIDNANE